MPVIARTLRARGNPFPQRCGFYVSDGSLSFCGKRKGGKNAAKTKVLESFSRLRCRPRRSPLTSRTGMCKICTLLSHGLCGAIRWPLTRARTALTQQGYTLRLPCYAQHFLSSFRRGRCPHRPALPRNLQHSVGVGLPDDPNRAPTVPAAGHMGPSYKVCGCRTACPHAALREHDRSHLGGPMWASAPTKAVQEVQRAGDRKGRPYAPQEHSAPLVKNYVIANQCVGTGFYPARPCLF